MIVHCVHRVAIGLNQRLRLQILFLYLKAFKLQVVVLERKTPEINFELLINYRSCKETYLV
jgi:hypothetical protein